MREGKSFPWSGSVATGKRARRYKTGFRVLFHQSVGHIPGETQ